MSKGEHCKTAAFICELRDDPGFGAPLLCIADELARLAAEESCQLRTIFVLSDPIYYGHEAASHGHIVLPGPPTRRLFEIDSQARSYANLLATIGFAHASQLELLVKAWDGLFAELSPDLIVLENSPTACIAARQRIPLFVTGSAFSVPPADHPAFPSLTREGQSETNQTVIRDAINNVLERRGARPAQSLPELFAGDRRAVFGLAQLDPYHACRQERLLPPCTGFKGPLARHDGPSVFFAAPSRLPGLVGIARALEQAGAAVSCYVPGSRAVGVTLLQQIGAHVLATRPRLTSVLSQAAAVLAVGADLAIAAYVAGRPQVLVPEDLETSLMATELERRRTAVVLDAANPNQIGHAVREILDNPAYTQSAMEEARRLKIMTAWEQNPAELAARECLEMLR